ncbi:MAG TPA: hypothetical protein VKT25_01685, partial [Ktedonobacteraceae bacterium]|nr:hypothetical protein [Ktedonobacteraceae bacterium]
HYGIRFALVLVLTLAVYLGTTLLFRQAVQLPALLTLLFIAMVTERLWVLLEWVGPVVGTMNKRKREREQRQVVEYLLECSLRYHSPLVIAALRCSRRVSRHVVSRYLRKSDIVVRTTPGYLLVIMPFTTLGQALVPLKRITAGLPIKGVVVADMHMLRAQAETQDRDALYDNEDSVATSRELRQMCFQAFDERFATLKIRSTKGSVPAISYLFEPDSPQTMIDRLEADIVA